MNSSLQIMSPRCPFPPPPLAGTFYRKVGIDISVAKDNHYGRYMNEIPLQPKPPCILLGVFFYCMTQGIWNSLVPRSLARKKK